MLENVRNLCSLAFLQDLFSRCLPQNGTKGYERISYFYVNYENVFILGSFHVKSSDNPRTFNLPSQKWLEFGV